jgi:hypothetical protein
MGWFMNIAWNVFSGAGLLVVGLIYIACFTLLGNYFWTKPNFKLVGGLLYTVAVSIVPLSVYGLEKMLGIWPGQNPGEYTGFHVWVRGGWIVMELATVVVSLAYLHFRRFPFLMAPIAYSLWFLSMDITPLLQGKLGEPNMDERRFVSLAFGVLMTTLAIFIDKRFGRAKGDFGFWLCLFGGLLICTSMNSILYENKSFGRYLAVLFNVAVMLAGVGLRRKTFVVLGGLGYLLSFVTLFWQLNELAKVILVLIHLFVMALGVLLQRKAFTVIGAIQLFFYFGHLAWTIFKDAFMFPIVLTFLGLAAIFLGVLYQRKQAQIVQFIEDSLPNSLYLRLRDYQDEYL